MKRTLERVITTLLALTMLACLPALSLAEAAPVNNEYGVTPAGTFPITAEKQEFTVMITQWADQDPATAWITDIYEDMSNVHVNWIVVPSDGFKDRVAITFASGSMPDVIAGMGGVLTAAEELQYAAQGLLQPLDEVIERSSIHFKQFLEENPQTRKLISQDDGHIYSLPGLAVCYHCNYSQKFFINKVWLDNVGMGLPTTTDELYDVLKAFKEQDANGNGDPNDEIPLITCLLGWHVDLDGYLMNAFIYSDPDTYMAVEDGSLIYTPTQEGYREGLRYLNKLYANELLSPESFTNNESTNSKINVAAIADPKDWENSAAVIGSYPFAYQNYSGDTDIWKQYEILAPIAGPDGFVTTPEYSLVRDTIRANMLITKDAKNPDLIMRWVDWFYTKEGTRFRDGREGIEWRYAEPGELDFNGNQAEIVSLTTPEDDPFYGNVDWTQSIVINSSKSVRETLKAAQDFRDPTINNGTEVQLFQGTKAYEAVARDVNQSIPGLSVPIDQISEYARIETELKSYVKTSMVKFITGDMDLDKDWDTFQNNLKRIGLEQYMEMANTAYSNFINR
ncbi:MAG: extracellular solute-binding protein [Oscillospiraceae bacterium]|jgi:putative aldouronate transport system substrate-binding protein|nr:extracellular solute-binding protein [Oscillospiraceae bacterium]